MGTHDADRPDLSPLRRAVQLRDRCRAAAVANGDRLGIPLTPVQANVAYDAMADLIRADEREDVASLPDHLRGDGPCQDCGTVDNIVWFAENVLWNHVMAATTPGEENPAFYDPGGIVCIPCFIKRVDAAGLAPTGWRLLPEWRWTERAPNSG